MKQPIKRILAQLAPAPSAPGFRVLLYHAIGTRDPADRLALRLPLTAFRAQMQLLQTLGYHVVPLQSLLDGSQSAGTGQVAITFDDGYRSQLEAVQILEEFGFPATFFVVARFLDGDYAATHYWERWEHMEWRDVRMLSERGFEIGAHSVSHRRLSLCTPTELREEVGGARSYLEDCLGRVVLSFSYPYGVHNHMVRHVVEDSGYRLACTSECGTNRCPWRYFELRRTEISGADGLGDFRRKLSGKYDWLGPLHRWRALHA